MTFEQWLSPDYNPYPTYEYDAEAEYHDILDGECEKDLEEMWDE